MGSSCRHNLILCWAATKCSRQQVAVERRQTEVGAELARTWCPHWGMHSAAVGEDCPLLDKFARDQKTRPMTHLCQMGAPMTRRRGADQWVYFHSVLVEVTLKMSVDMETSG